MKDITIKKVFGGQKLQAADASVIATLESLGPWGIAALAAYLAGQGLVQLAQKVQSMRASTGFTSSVPLTSEETARIKQAIADVQMTNLSVESQEWIKNNPPQVNLSQQTDLPVLGISLPPIAHVTVEDITDAIKAVEKAEADVKLIPPLGPHRCEALVALWRSVGNTIYWLESLPEGSGSLRDIFWYAERKLSDVHTELRDAIEREGCLHRHNLPEE